MALFTDGGSRYLAIGRTPHKLGVYILDDGNPRPLRMTFPGLSRFPAWLPTYFPLGALPLDRGCRRRRSLDGKDGYSRAPQFTHPAPWPARLCARSSTDHERHLTKSSSHSIALNADHVERIRRVLTALQDARSPRNLDLPGWRLHQLKGDRRGQWSGRVSGNWRKVFRFADGEAVDVDLIDYH